VLNAKFKFVNIVKTFSREAFHVIRQNGPSQTVQQV